MDAVEEEEPFGYYDEEGAEEAEAEAEAEEAEAEEISVSSRRNIKAETGNNVIPSEHSISVKEASWDNPFQYPDVKRTNTLEYYLDQQKIRDPYRWLENSETEETQSFIEEQNTLTELYLEKSSWRDAIRAKLTEMWDFKKMHCPKKFGSRFFFLQNNGLQNQPILFSKESLDEEARVLMDPNELSEDGHASISGFSVSQNGEYIAYSLTEYGSEWSTIYIKSVSSGQNFLEALHYVKGNFNVEWGKDNRGFFYSRYPKPKKRKVSGVDYNVNIHQKLFYHRIGTRQDDDVIVVEFPDHPTWAISSSVTLDGRFLILSAGDTLQEQLTFYMDIGWKGAITREMSKLVLFPQEGHHEYLANDETNMYFLTDVNAPNYQIVSFEITHSMNKQEWVTIVEENPTAVIVWAHAVANDKLAICYNEHLETRLEIRKLENGDLMKAIVFEDNISAKDHYGRRDLADLYVKVESYVNPGIIYKLSFDSDNNVDSEIYEKVEIPYFEPEQFHTELTFYSNDDGTNIPMTLVYKSTMEKDGNTPCILFGHGGGRKSILPEFQVPFILFAQNFDGVMAIANIRGGGEYGKNWWDQGRLLNKDNAIEDLIAAANFLINNKYCRSSKLAVMGHGHGATTVAAAINKRPELFGAAICDAGVMDLLRFSNFTIGHLWVSEYGSATEPEELENILRISPLHNITAPTSDSPQYPAVFVNTADNDDRVVPIHSYKYIAELQYTVGQTMNQTNPLLMRVHQNIGHGSGTPTMKEIEKATDLLCYLENALDFEFHF